MVSSAIVIFNTISFPALRPKPEPIKCTTPSIRLDTTRTAPPNWLRSNVVTLRHFHQVLDQGLVSWAEDPEGFWTSSLDGVRLFDKVAAVRVLTV